MITKQEVIMQEVVARVARAIARKDNPRILDGSENGVRLWESGCEHYVALAFAALDAVIGHGLGEDEKLGRNITGDEPTDDA
jgi:hypothetical protein